MKKCILFLFLLIAVKALPQQLSVESKKVKNAFTELIRTGYTSASMLNYIECFPSDTQTFLPMFASEKFDQLYDGHEYIDALEKCGGRYPKEVIRKCINIGKDLAWDADAVAYLQDASVRLAFSNPSIFAQEYHNLSSTGKNGLIAFYADVENHRVYKDYQALIDSMKTLDHEIAQKLEIARTERIKMDDH